MRIAVGGFLFLAMLGPAWAEARGVYLVVSSRGDAKKFEDELRGALAGAPSLKLLAAAAPDALFITIPDGIHRAKNDAGDSYTFTALFSYRGKTLGQSYVNCTGGKTKECSDQLATDAQSAALAVTP